MKTPPSPPLPATHKPTFLSPFSFLTSPSTQKPSGLKPTNASVKPPPAGFDFRSSDILRLSTATVAEKHPELTELAEGGSLVRIDKKQFGPVPEWKSEFMEPEEIWLVGTTHISRDSGLDVERVVKALKPDNVVVELCKSRAGIMYTSNEDVVGQQLRSNMFSLSGSEFLGAIGRSINLGGQTALALRLLLALMSSKISSDVNQPFGDEFRAARKAAEEVGAQIVLGDRPIEITLERAWHSLNWTEKLNLVVSVSRGIISTSEESKELEGSSMDVSPFQLYQLLSFSYPSLLQPLIHERDMYLAWSLKRSKAVNNSKRVVGVIGKGHLNGVIYALISDQGNLRFRDLVGKASSGSDANNSLNPFASTKETACKYMRKRCPPDCIFSPYFPPDYPQRYASVHKIYGASNIARMLQDLPVHVRRQAVESLCVEAEYRIEDPVYGCVKIISQLQQEIHIAMNQLARTQAEIAFVVACFGQESGLNFDQ